MGISTRQVPPLYQHASHPKILLFPSSAEYVSESRAPAGRVETPDVVERAPSLLYSFEKTSEKGAYVASNQSGMNMRSEPLM